MTRFLHHEPCPACRSRDNLGRYSDGHAWCFGCGYYEKAERTLETVRQEQQKGEVPDVLHSIDADCIRSIPNQALGWLRKYGITDEEIHDNNILWHPGKEGLTLGTQLRLFSAREGSPKCVTVRRPGYDDFHYIARRPSEVGIFVEDFISAVKVGRSWAGIPIYGSNVPAEALEWAARTFLKVGIWLDSDMAAKAFKTVSRARVQYGEDKFFRIFSDLDPKCYGTEEIDRLVSTNLGNFSC